MRIVVTGGPGCGKTSLVEALGRRGYATVPEAAIGVIDELNRELGIEGQRRFRREERERFQTLVATRQVELEAGAPSTGEPVFFDRGLLDGLAYCRHFGIAPPPALIDAACTARYDAVLLLDPLSHFPDRPETGRTSDQATSLALAAAIDAIYREHAYVPVRVAELPIDERADRALALLRIEPRER